MNWLINLFTGNGIAHSILILAIVITIGVLFGKIKIFGISFGVTWILFVGIAFAHFGLTMDRQIMNFVRDFGLILFVFAVALQGGPGFFASFKKMGIRLNLLTIIIVVIGAGVTIVLKYMTNLSSQTMVGVMSGAVTNTPGLGAAQQTYLAMSGSDDPSIASGYAVAYPLGAVGVILVLLALKAAFKVNIDKEKEKIGDINTSKDSAIKMTVEVCNDAICGKCISDINHILKCPFVISHVCHKNGSMEMPVSGTVIHAGDKLLIITSKNNIEAIKSCIGKKIDMDQETWDKLDTNSVSRRLVVTQSHINGKTLADLNIRSHYGINVTRVNRAGIDLLARPNLALQLGDRVMVVGSERAIAKVADLLGNEVKKLREPNLIPIFFGILLGIFIGSIPIVFPGVSQPVKLGLAGGTLIVGILIGRFGPSLGMVTYTTASSNMMLREIGIALFLAAVGLGAGENFVDAVVNGGYMWILYGAIITIIPILTAAILGRFIFKMDYFSISGLICGSQTNPIALAFMNNTYQEGQIATAYATVYPLAMFLRIIVAQLLILFI